MGKADYYILVNNYIVKVNGNDTDDIAEAIKIAIDKYISYWEREYKEGRTSGLEPNEDFFDSISDIQEVRVLETLNF